MLGRDDGLNNGKEGTERDRRAPATCITSSDDTRTVSGHLVRAEQVVQPAEGTLVAGLCIFGVGAGRGRDTMLQCRGAGSGAGDEPLAAEWVAPPSGQRSPARRRVSGIVPEPVLSVGGIEALPRSRRRSGLPTADHDRDVLVDDTVLAGLAHELRTPLTTLHITVEALAEHSTLVPDDLRYLLARMYRAVAWMNALVDNLSTWSAIRGGRLTLHPEYGPVTDWINTALAVAQPILDRKQQTVDVACPTPVPLVVGDAIRLGQVVLNLLTNAGRYSLAGDVIALRVSAQRGLVSVSITDHGPGIPVAEQPRIFGPHVRGQRARELAVSGEGLGLSIVHEIVRLHGGSVGVSSTVGHGATFWFTLPEAVSDPLRAHGRG